MIVIYLRSSSVGTYIQCDKKYYYSFVLGIPEEPRVKTVKGTIVHKALELYARAGIAGRLGKNYFEDQDFGKINVDQISPEFTVGKAFNLYKDERFAENDKKDCIDWVYSVLQMEGGFDPRKLNVIDSEVHFDIIINKNWAKYEWDLQGKKHKGHLSLKGTIDIVCSEGDLLEIVDWKTGQRKDWVSGKKKEYADFKTDHQLLLYYYVARKLYPNYKSYCATIVYINDGGAFTVHFDEADLEVAENMLRDVFEQIKQNNNPKGINPHPFCKICHYGINSFENPKKWPNGQDKTICQQLTGELMFVPIEKVTAKYAQNNLKHLTHYTEGGGRKHW